MVSHAKTSTLRVDERFATILPPPENLDAIRESVREHGIQLPLLVTEDGLVLDGHMRLGLARELGLVEVPVIRLPVGAGATWHRTLALALSLPRRHLNVVQRVALGTSLEKLERVKAKDRQVGAGREGRKGGRPKGGNPGGDGDPQGSAPAPKSPRDEKAHEAGKSTARAAAAVGVSRGTYERAKAVLERAAPAVRERALSGKLSIAAAHMKLRRADVEAQAEAVMAGALPSAKPNRGLYDDLLAPPAGWYRTIYADAPWAYGDEGTRGVAAGHYPTMTPDELGALDVGRLAHPEGCHLWSWTTWPKIRDGVPHRVLEAWGFRWVGEVVWKKPRIGTGRWLRSTTEVLVLAVRGNMPLLVDDQGGFFEAATGAHSEKPAEARLLVERCSPGPRIELFGRVVPEGWDGFGNECRR